jgi:hypothetical protein
MQKAPAWAPFACYREFISREEDGCPGSGFSDPGLQDVRGGKNY